MGEPLTFLVIIKLLFSNPHALLWRLWYARGEMWFKVAHWLPRGLVYWCGIRILSNATTGRYALTEVPAIGAAEALERWQDTDSEKEVAHARRTGSVIKLEPTNGSNQWFADWQPQVSDMPRHGGQPAQVE